MKKSLSYIFAIISCTALYSEQKQAACLKNPNFSGANKTLPSKTYNVQFDNTDTITLDTLNTTNFVSTTTRLSDVSPNDVCGAVWVTKLVGPWVNRLSGTQISTNLPGIYLIINTAFPVNVPGQSSPPTATSYLITPSYHWTVTIKKQGQATQSGYIDGGIIADYYQLNTVQNNRFDISKLTIPTNGIRINVLSCSLKNNKNTYDINMGDWYDTQFKNINDTQGTVAIPIALSCIAGTNIKVTVNSDNIDNAANGRLGLTGADKATGIAVQLLNNAGTPIVLNQQFTQQNGVPQGDYIFGWKARYIKTAAAVTPGTANANATVNIRYE